MKRYALSLLLATLGLAALLLAAGCVSNLREPARGTNSWPGFIEAEIWSDHKYYEFGEPVRIRVTLKNISREIQILGKSGTQNASAVDVTVQAGGEEHSWSQEHSEDAKRLITLRPNESYTIGWTLTPTLRSTYNINAWWKDQAGYQDRVGVSIYYGVRPPGPMP
jgi:hypothetical protein